MCEGSDFWTDKNLSLEVGRIFIQAMAEYYALPSRLTGGQAGARSDVRPAAVAAWFTHEAGHT